MQQTILRQAAAAAQEQAIIDHPGYAEVAMTSCAEAGAVVLANEE